MHRLGRVLSLVLVLALSAPSAALAAAPLSRIESVIFTDATNGYMSGGYVSGGNAIGFISRTGDGGGTWTPWSVPNRWMVGVDAFSAASAWAIPSFWHQGWYTTNTGASWTNSAGFTSPSGAERGMDVAQVNSLVAIVSGKGSSQIHNTLATLWRTADSGATWTEVLESGAWPQNSDGSYPRTFAGYEAVDAASDGAVFAVGWLNAKDSDQVFLNALIARSTAGGAPNSWASAAAPAGTPVLEDVAAVSASVAWATGGTSGAESRVIKTTNGTTWATTTQPKEGKTSVNLNGIAAVSADKAAVVGDGGKVGVTVDGGVTWKFWTLPAKVTLSAVAFRDANHLMVAGDDQHYALLTIGPDGTIIDAKPGQAVNGAVGAPVPDNTPPVTRHSEIPAGWSNANVTFTLSAEDGPGGSGVASTKYTLNGGPEQVYTGPKTITAEGITQLRYWSVDKTGNTEAVKGPFEVKIDKTKPTTTDNAAQAYTGSANITLTPNDTGGSGLKATKWRINENPWSTGTSISISTNGTHTLEYFSVDNAGNEEPIKSKQFTVNDDVPDNTPPVTTSDTKSSYDGIAVINLVASDDSGIARTEYRLNGGTWMVGKSVTIDAAGSYTLEFKSTDKANNTELAKSAHFTVWAATDLRLTAPTTAPKYGGSAKLTATLRTPAATGKPVSGKTVIFERWTGSKWVSIGSATTLSTGTAVKDATGITAKTSYRARFAQSSPYRSSVSPLVAVTPKVYLTKPAFRLSTSGKSYATIKKGRTYIVNGTLKPRHASGSKEVKLKVYRYKSGKYRYYKTYTTAASNITGGSRYSVKLKLPYKGKWRVRAYHAADTKNAKTYSSYRYVTVK